MNSSELRLRILCAEAEVKDREFWWTALADLREVLRLLDVAQVGEQQLLVRLVEAEAELARVTAERSAMIDNVRFARERAEKAEAERDAYKRTQDAMDANFKALEVERSRLQRCEALEEAAMACDNLATPYNNLACRDCAAAIRALKDRDAQIAED